MGASALKPGAVAAVGALAYTAYNTIRGAVPAIAQADHIVELSAAPKGWVFMPV